MEILTLEGKEKEALQLQIKHWEELKSKTKDVLKVQELNLKIAQARKKLNGLELKNTKEDNKELKDKYKYLDDINQIIDELYRIDILEAEAVGDKNKALELERDRLKEIINYETDYFKIRRAEIELMKVEERLREKKIAEEGSLLERFMYGFRISEAKEEIQSFGELVIEAGKEASDKFADAFADAFMDFAKGAKSAKDAFGDFASDVIKWIGRMYSEWVAKQIFTSIMGFIPSFVPSIGTSSAGTVSTSAPTIPTTDYYRLSPKWEDLGMPTFSGMSSSSSKQASSVTEITIINTVDSEDLVSRGIARNKNLILNPIVDNYGRRGITKRTFRNN